MSCQVGHNIYILCHQLSKHSPELERVLGSIDEAAQPLDQLQRALAHYSRNTAQIEVRLHALLRAA